MRGEYFLFLACVNSFFSFSFSFFVWGVRFLLLTFYFWQAHSLSDTKGMDVSAKLFNFNLFWLWGGPTNFYTK